MKSVNHAVNAVFHTNLCCPGPCRPLPECSTWVFSWLVHLRRFVAPWAKVTCPRQKKGFFGGGKCYPLWSNSFISALSGLTLISIFVIFALKGQYFPNLTKCTCCHLRQILKLSIHSVRIIRLCMVVTIQMKSVSTNSIFPLQRRHWRCIESAI